MPKGARDQGLVLRACLEPLEHPPPHPKAREVASPAQPSLEEAQIGEVPSPVAGLSSLLGGGGFAP